MADTTTELEVLDQIVDTLGGQSGQYETVVPTLQQIRDLLGGGGGGGGYNPALSVGRADALTGADETAQWAQRESTGSGSATVRSVQGASVVWNQLNSNNANSATVSGVTFTKNNDGSWTVDGTSTADVQKFIVTALSVVGGHSYLVKGCPAGGGVNSYSLGISNVTIDTGAGGIYTILSSSVGVGFMFNVSSGQTFSNVTFYPQFFDLTAMFGSGNEPTTVAEFEAMYPASYYPYSAPTLKPVQIAGIASTDAQGGELDSVEWGTQTLWGAGAIGDMLYSDHKETNIGLIDLGSKSWTSFSSGGNVVFYTQLNDMQQVSGQRSKCVNYTSSNLNPSSAISAASGMADKEIAASYGASQPYIYIRDSAYETASALKTALDGVYATYALATPTTTPISPALPMTYRVQQGGSESIIVPEGEISAAPLITLAEGESAGELVMDALACIATPDGPTATANHALGTYLTMQGKLYKVTSAIAVGETITPNTNVTQTTVMDELIALTA